MTLQQQPEHTLSLHAALAHNWEAYRLDESEVATHGADHLRLITLTDYGPDVGADHPERRVQVIVAYPLLPGEPEVTTPASPIVVPAWK